MSKSVKAFVGLSVVAALVLAAWMLSGTNAAPQHDDGKASESTAADANSDTLHLDAHARKQLGLAFAPAADREIVKLVSVPGVVSFDDRRVTHLKPRPAVGC